MTKHIGEDSTTYERFGILMVDQMQFSNSPADDGFCLVFSIDALPDMIKDEIREIIESPAAQQSNCLLEYFGTRTISNGVPVSNWLHNNGRIIRKSIDNVNLTPSGTKKVKLRDVVNAMRGTAAVQPVKLPNTPEQTVKELLDRAAELVYHAEVLKEQAAKIQATVPEVSESESESDPKE